MLGTVMTARHLRTATLEPTFMKYLITLTALTFSLGVSAEPVKPAQGTQQQLAKVNASLEQLVALTKEAQTQQKNPTREPKNSLLFCYVGDKAYSEGAKFEQRLCTRQAADMLENVRQRPMVWR